MDYQPLPLDSQAQEFLLPLAQAAQDAQSRLAMALQGVAIGMKLDPARVAGVMQGPDGLQLALRPLAPIQVAEVPPHDAGELVAAAPSKNGAAH